MKNTNKIANEILKSAEQDLTTFPCPECGTDVVRQSMFCLKCQKKVKEAASGELDPGWERISIILETDEYRKLQTLTNIKEIFVKDVVNDLIKIYNDVAVTDEDKKKIKEEKEKLIDEIKKLVEIQREESKNAALFGKKELDEIDIIIKFIKSKARSMGKKPKEIIKEIYQRFY